jgi:hypothetical protein
MVTSSKVNFLLFIQGNHHFVAEVFGDLTLNELGVVITFNFGDDVCNGSDKYCEVVMRAQNLILIQLRDSSKGEIFKNAFPFTFQRSEADFTVPLNESEMPWNWPLKGKDISKVGIFPAIAQGWQYYGGVFSTEHNAMILITQNTLNDIEFKGVINKLDTTTGQWQQWEHFGSIGFQGLFVLDYKLYGITPFENSIVEFKPDLTFTERVRHKNN